MDDQRKLMLAVNSNNRDELISTYEYIFNKYKSYVAFIASSYFDNIHDIDDVIQDVFISFFNNIKNVNKSIKSYLSVTTKNQCINLVKKRSRLLPSESIETLVSDQTNYSDTFNKLISDLSTVLNKQEIDIILMHVIDGLTFNEIAQKTNKKQSSIKTRYYNALKKYERKRK